LVVLHEVDDHSVELTALEAVRGAGRNSETSPGELRLHR
jgi:hypothetical protein